MANAKSILYETPVIVGLSVLILILVLMMATKPKFLQAGVLPKEDGKCEYQCCKACSVSLTKLLSFSVILGLVAGIGTYYWEQRKKSTS